MVLFQFGELVFDNYIKYDGLDPTPNARQDLDSYRDADGVLQRNALQHTASSIEFTTRVMWDSEFEPMIKQMVANYQNYAERDAICTYFDFENMEEKQGHFYLDANWKPHIMWWPDKKRILYGETPFKFVEY